MTNEMMRTFKELDEIYNNCSNETKEVVRKNIEIAGKIYDEYIELINKKYHDIQLIFTYLSEKQLNFYYRVYQIEQSCKQSNDFSCVYFIENKYTGFIKIGVTEKFHQRYKQLNSMFKNNFGIENGLIVLGIVIVPPTERAKLESFFHKKYKDYLTFGEWFNIDFEIIKQDFFCQSLMCKCEFGECYCAIIEEINYSNEIPLSVISKQLFQIDRNCFIEKKIKNIPFNSKDKEMSAYFLYKSKGIIYDYEINNPMKTLFNSFDNSREEEIISFYNWIINKLIPNVV